MQTSKILTFILGDTQEINKRVQLRYAMKQHPSTAAKKEYYARVTPGIISSHIEIREREKTDWVEVLFTLIYYFPLIFTIYAIMGIFKGFQGDGGGSLIFLSFLGLIYAIKLIYNKIRKNASRKKAVLILIGLYCIYSFALYIIMVFISIKILTLITLATMILLIPIGVSYLIQRDREIIKYLKLFFKKNVDAFLPDDDEKL